MTSMVLTRWRLLCLLFAATLAPQYSSAQDTDGTGEISGRVISAETGQPIEHAEVTLDLPLGASHSWTHKATTDKDGHYALTWLPAGKFTVTATAETYVAQVYRHPDETDPLTSITLTLGEAASVSGIDFRLANAGSVHGAIVDQSGDSVGEGVSVTAVQPTKDANRTKPYEPVMSAATDKDGHFLLKGLAPGIYRVCVNGPDGYNFGPSKAKIAYRETWLGDATTYDAAQTAEVRAGDPGADLRIIAPRIATHSLTVVPVWTPTPEVANIKPDLFDASIAGRNQIAKRNPDGSVTIPNLPAGRYVVHEDAWLTDKYIGHGEAEVEINDTDMTLRIKVMPAAAK